MPTSTHSGNDMANTLLYIKLEHEKLQKITQMLPDIRLHSSDMSTLVGQQCAQYAATSSLNCK